MFHLLALFFASLVYAQCDDCPYQERQCVSTGKFCHENHFGNTNPCGSASTLGRSKCFLCDNGDYGTRGSSTQRRCIYNTCTELTANVGDPCCPLTGSSVQADCDRSVMGKYCKSGTVCNYNATTFVGVCENDAIGSSLWLSKDESCVAFTTQDLADAIIPEFFDRCNPMSGLRCRPDSDPSSAEYSYSAPPELVSTESKVSGSCVYAQCNDGTFSVNCTFLPNSCRTQLDCGLNEKCDDGECVPGLCIQADLKTCTCYIDNDCPSTTFCHRTYPTVATLGGKCTEIAKGSYGDKCSDDRFCRDDLYCSSDKFCERPAPVCPDCLDVTGGSRCGLGMTCQCAPTTREGKNNQPRCLSTNLNDATSQRFSVTKNELPVLKCLQDNSIPRFMDSPSYRRTDDLCSQVFASTPAGTIQTCAALAQSLPADGRSYSAGATRSPAVVLYFLLGSLLLVL